MVSSARVVRKSPAWAVRERVVRESLAQVVKESLVCPGRESPARVVRESLAWVWECLGKGCAAN